MTGYHRSYTDKLTNTACMFLESLADCEAGADLQPAARPDESDLWLVCDVEARHGKPSSDDEKADRVIGNAVAHSAITRGRVPQWFSPSRTVVHAVQVLGLTVRWADVVSSWATVSDETVARILEGARLAIVHAVAAQLGDERAS